jgi:beta-glucosidase
VADALFGAVNPSGKLCVSIPHSEGQLPIYYNYRPRGRGDYVDLPTKPLYPFGFGLSYTSFAYRDLAVENREGNRPARVMVTVENVGRRAGAEVAQLYLQDIKSSVTRRVAELKAFEKVFLQPGEARRLRFELDDEAFGLWNEEMAWVIEPGEFEVRVGGDSTATLKATLTVGAQAEKRNE